MSLFLSYFVSFTKDNDEKKKKKTGRIKCVGSVPDHHEESFFVCLLRGRGFTKGK